ncbi:methionine--tRNA ligase [Patescibacteria group bacterium]|nr:methionine--tRNA ligase [Patescibacteria group bacterium]MBU1256348.1 methionine--tRNA ligase [Patescibacteria group bacterium]MBU1457200.1 methionine--tRNA ligase [Patescibacteria group bacterium]
MSKKKFYVTAAIPYVNAKPHIGHALEFIETDVVKRFKKLQGFDVLSLSGGDENALKNVQAAEVAQKDIQDFVDENTEKFRKLAIKLDAEFDGWQKGSDKKVHYPSSQKLWELCKKNGDIYEENYTGLYCVGCEAFYTKNELNEDGECKEHPGKKLEEVAEKNYFFKLSNYQDKLLKLIKSKEFEIVPKKRENEVLSFIELGLKDISISRSNERARNWGVPVPGDNGQRIYVWMDALNIYQSGIGFGWDEKKYEKWWPADVHVIGKGILRFHAVYWPAFLLSAGLKLPKKIFVHEYLTVDGQKMSKTVGNVYDPVPLLEKMGADPLRYYLLAKISPFADGDFSEEKVYQTYTSDLVNGLGNLTARVAAMAEGEEIIIDSRLRGNDVGGGMTKGVGEKLEGFEFDKALGLIWDEIRKADKLINEKEVWKLEGEKKKEVLTTLINQIRQIGVDLQPFLPETAKIIIKQFAGPKIVRGKNLFERL